MQSVYREEVLGNNGLSGCRVDQAYTGYGCDRTDNRCEKEEPAEQDYRIGKFVTYVFDYVNTLSSQVCFVAVLVFSLIQKPPVIVKVRNN